jgi:hypothetical protein
VTDCEVTCTNLQPAVTRCLCAQANPQCREKRPALIESTTVVLALADSALSDGFGIVDAMVDGLERTQIREDSLQVGIVHLSEKPPRRDGANPPGTDFPRMHGLQELGFIVIADTGRIGVKFAQLACANGLSGRRIA